MGTPTRRTTERSRISTWGGGEGGHQGDRHRESAVYRRPHSTQLGHPSSHLQSWFRLYTLGLGGARGTPQAPGFSPPPSHCPGHSHQSWPRMYTTLAAPFHPVHPEFAPCPRLCFLHCTPARPRPLPQLPQLRFPQPQKKGQRKHWLGTAVGVGTPPTSFSPSPNKREG